MKKNTTDILIKDTKKAYQLVSVQLYATEELGGENYKRLISEKNDLEEQLEKLYEDKYGKMDPQVKKTLLTGVFGLTGIAMIAYFEKTLTLGTKAFKLIKFL